jgi:CubicO group peptidase (beta-lactamase class C family)
LRRSRVCFTATVIMAMMRRRRFTSSGLMAAAIGLLSGVARADSIDDAVASVMTQHKIPGLSLAIVESGKVVQARAYGVVTAGSPDPVRTDTLFQPEKCS